MVCADSALTQELVDLSSAKPKLVRASNYAAPADPNVSAAYRGLEDKHSGRLWRRTQLHVHSFLEEQCLCRGLGTGQTLGHFQARRRASQGREKLSHADAGEKWVRKYLAKKGRTEADLAGVLWEKKRTAVAEMTGLHLHGLNESIRAFETQPQAVVDAFAEWGFIKTASTELFTVAAARGTASPCVPSSRSASARPAYPPGASFFKVKFNEPYMMYRDWHEVTKMLLSMRCKAKGKGKDGMSVDALPKAKMRCAETTVYARWVVEEIRRDPAAFAEYSENKGIVAVRERFLAYLASEKGKKVLKSTPSEKEEKTPEKTQATSFMKTIIIPVAIPGCGPQSGRGCAFSSLRLRAHSERRREGEETSPVFIKNVTKLLKKHEFVIADRNNHLAQHRQALRAVHLSARLLNWPIDSQPPALVHRLCAQRIQARGANHQTLRPNDAGLHEDVLWTFLNKAEPLAPSEVDEMSFVDGLERTCATLSSSTVPTEAEVEEALERARGCEVDEGVKRGDPPPPPGGKKDLKKRYYYAFLPEIALEPLPVLAEGGDGDVAATEAFWARCKALSDMGRATVFRMRLGHVVWNERVMAATVDEVELVEEKADNERVMAVTVAEVELAEEVDVSEQTGAEFVKQLPAEAKGRLHITVGTAGEAQPVEAKALVEAWRKDEGTVQSIPLGGIVAMARVKKLY
ncbi:hypothetical protein C8R45DRAFT_1078478 [Mycena sanguinolenta]|nr:hypothetical protein C8R45DRAFT_1078478 [Mycena sanguinolenta]